MDINVSNSDKRFPATSLCICILGTRIKPAEALSVYFFQTRSIIMVLTQKNTVYNKYQHVFALMGVRCTLVSRTQGETAQRCHTNFTLEPQKPSRSDSFHIGLKQECGQTSTTGKKLLKNICSRWPALDSTPSMVLLRMRRTKFPLDERIEKCKRQRTFHVSKMPTEQRINYTNHLSSH